MAGDLARECRVLLPHPVLDVRVADPVDERHAAGPGDRLRHGPARAHVVDDLRARLLLQQHLGEEGGDEIAGDELARVVDEEAAVGVAVEGDAELGALLEGLADDELAVLGQERVRLVVRERPVRLEEAAHRLDRQSLQDRRQHCTRHPVRRVDDDAQRLDRIDLDEREHLLHVGRPDVVVVDMSGGRTPGPVRNGHRTVADLEQPRLAAYGQRAGPDDLHAGVLLRVVGRGHGRAAVQA